MGFQYKILYLVCLFSVLCEGGRPFEFISIPFPHSCAFPAVPWPGGTQVTEAHHSELSSNTLGPHRSTSSLPDFSGGEVDEPSRFSKSHTTLETKTTNFAQT